MTPLWMGTLACAAWAVKWTCECIEKLLDRKWFWAAIDGLAAFGVGSASLALWRMIP